MPEALLSIQNLAYTVENKQILTQLSFKVFPHEILSIIGPNGSGKTTILKLINLLISGHQGSITYNFAGLMPVLFEYSNITKNSKRKIEKDKILLRRQMHLIFQKPVVFTGSVLENCLVCGPLRGRRFTKEQAMNALEKVHIASLYHQPASTLSGGEMTRLSLARALLIKPQLLLLDEPSANLDPKGIQLFEEIITHMAKQQPLGIILVTQDMFQARRISHRVGLLLHGNIIEMQPNPDFFNHPKRAETNHFISGDIVI